MGAAWSGFVLAVIGWLVGTVVQSGSITIENLGKSEVMLSGNLIAICSSGIIHYVFSMIYPQNFNFDTLDANIKLVEVEETSGLTAEDKDPEVLDKAYKWITRRGWVLTIVLVVIWPLLSIPWGFGAAIVITVLPIMESSDEISTVLSGLFCFVRAGGEKSDEYVERETEDKGKVEDA